MDSNFHLILPSMLTLLDSSHAKVRTHGTIILSNVLYLMDGSFLARTGLAELIWATVFPNLSSLPPITELNESVELLQVTYNALLELARLWHPCMDKRAPLLDKLVRDGVIYAMMFSGEQLRIAKVELESLRLIV